MLNNASSQMSIVFTRSTKLWIANNIYIENSTASFQYILAFTETNNITLSNITFTNVKGINTDAYSILYLQTYSGGFITVDGFNIINSEIDKHKGIYADIFGDKNGVQLTLVNCIFSNITMSSGTKFISSSVLK